MAPIVRLGKRLADAAQAIGLRLVAFGVVPDPEGGDHQVKAGFVPADTPPALTADPEFDAIIEAQVRHEQEERAKKARNELEEFRKNLEDEGGSFL